jgi:hypothetical protein
MDLGIHRQNGPDSDLSKWPEFTSSYSPGEMIERDLEVYNDGLKGNHITVVWEARWDSFDGELVDSGRIVDIKIEPGFHQTVKLKFPVPETEVTERKLNIVFRSELEGEEVFKEDDLYFLVNGTRK